MIPQMKAPFFKIKWWWMLIPLLLIIAVPGWERLGDFLGYDRMPAPDATPPRYDSAVLGSFYYLVWWVLMLVAVFPGHMLTMIFGSLVPDSARFMVSVVLSSLIYSVALFLLWCYIDHYYRKKKGHP